jgi:hypothetical protein
MLLESIILPEVLNILQNIVIDITIIIYIISIITYVTITNISVIFLEINYYLSSVSVRIKFVGYNFKVSHSLSAPIW